MAVRSADRSQVFPSEVATHEVVLALVGCLFLPLYFIHLPGISLGPGDLLIAGAGLSYVLRTGRYSIGPDKLTAIGVFGFLFMALVSVAWTPLPAEGLLDSFQLVLIFIVVVPSLILTFRTPQHRWYLFVLLTTMLSLLIIASAVEILLTSPVIGKYEFYGFGKQNTFHWTVMIGTILLGFLTLQPGVHPTVRTLAGVIGVVGAGIVIAGLTLSAVIGLLVAAWIVTYIVIQRADSPRLGALFWAGTIIAGGLGLAVVLLNWETVYQEGALYSRIPMYREAAFEGAEAFPLGHGIGSSPVALDDLPQQIPRSTHNFFLHYWLEIGVGAFGFLLILYAWVRQVALRLIRQTVSSNPYEIAFCVVFVSYLTIAIFQPPPVRRVWWMFFAVSWATVLSSE